MGGLEISNFFPQLHVLAKLQAVDLATRLYSEQSWFEKVQKISGERSATDSFLKRNFRHPTLLKMVSIAGCFLT